MFPFMLADVAIAPVLCSQVEFTYFDGNNNTWLICANCIEYRPVTPQMSGSGLYSGGKPFSVAIASDQFRQIRSLLQTALNNAKHHRANREKGDSSITQKQSDRSVNLARSSKSQLAIENWLNSLPKP